MNAAIERALKDFEIEGFETEGYEIFRSRSQTINGDDVFGLVKLTTDNLNRLGKEYSNPVRRQIHMELFDHFEPVITEMDDRLIVDFYPTLEDETSKGSGPVEEGFGMPDETPEIISRKSAVEEDIIEKNSIIDEYTSSWGMDDILTHTGFVISPDPVTMNVLDSFYNQKPDASVIEFGAGIGASGYVADQNGAEDFTFVELDEKVADYVSKKFPSYKVENENALQYDIEENYDLAILGIPYGLEPGLMEQQGRKLEEKVDNLVVQSGSPGFCRIEHDMVAGKFDERWPGYDQSQSVQKYFDQTSETRFEYQLAVLAGPDIQELKTRLEDEKGHKPVK